MGGIEQLPGSNSDGIKDFPLNAAFTSEVFVKSMVAKKMEEL